MISDIIETSLFDVSFDVAQELVTKCVTSAVTSAIEAAGMIKKRAVAPHLQLKHFAPFVVKPDAERQDCPIEPVEEGEWDLTEFVAYCTDDLRVGEVTQGYKKSAMLRFLGLFDITYPPCGSQAGGRAAPWCIGFVSACHRQNLFTKAFSLPFMGPAFGWGREMLTTFKQFAEYAQSEAIKHEFEKDVADINVLKLKFVSFTKDHTEGKNEANNAKFDKDANRLDEVPTKEEYNQVIQQSMFDIHFLGELVKGKEELTVAEKHSKNTLLMGNLYHNGKGGRCKEWMTMEMDYVRKTVLTEGGDYLQSAKHKMFKKRGKVLKVLSKGSIEVLKRILALPGADKQKFLFEGAKGGGLKNSASNYLKAYDKMYFGRVVHRGVNFVRKRVAQNAKVRKDENAEKYQKAGTFEDMHGEAVTDRTYCALSAKKKAELARKCLQVEIDPVDFPSPEQLAEMAPKMFAPDVWPPKRNMYLSSTRFALKRCTSGFTASAAKRRKTMKKSIPQEPTFF